MQTQGKFQGEEDFKFIPVKHSKQHHIHAQSAPSIFLTKVCKPSHVYPTIFSSHEFLVPTLKLKNYFRLERLVTFEQHLDSNRKKLPKKVSQNSAVP